MHQVHKPLLGIAYMCAAMFSFMSVSALLKLMGNTYDILHVVFFRNFFALIPLFLILKKTRQPLKTHHLKTHGIRAFGGVISHACLFSSILLLPFGDANILSFATTLAVCVFSALFLKEKLNLGHWLAVLVGFVGVALIARPSGNLNTTGVICALVSVILESAVMTHNRPFSRHEHPARIVFYYAMFASLFAVMGILFLTFVMERPFVIPTPGDSIRLILFGIGGGLGQYFITQSYAHAEARIVAPFIYSAMLWSLGYGIFLFSEALSLPFVMGAFLIVGSGIYILRTQKNSRKSTLIRET